MAKHRSRDRDLADAALELSRARENLMWHKTALDRVRAFLLRLHNQAHYLPSDLAVELVRLLGPLLNETAPRPAGRAAQRSRIERRLIVAEYEAAVARHDRSGAAVLRKYGIRIDRITQWRRDIEDGREAPDPEFLLKTHAFVEALGRAQLPPSDFWAKKEREKELVARKIEEERQEQLERERLG
jgi:hypothetical protein